MPFKLSGKMSSLPPDGDVDTLQQQQGHRLMGI